MTYRAWGAATLLLLAGCGGGSDEPSFASATATDSTAPVALSQLRSALAAQTGAAAPAAAASPAQAADQLLDFAERSFPQLFPSHQTTGATDPFLFRYYPQTRVYVGVVVKAGQGYTLDGVYVMGGPYGSKPIYVGQLSAFITPVDTARKNNGCYDLALMDTAGTQIEVVLQHSGDATGAVTQVSTVNGPKTFEGHAATETLVQQTGIVTVSGGVASLDNEMKLYQRRTADTELSGYGSDGVIRTSAAANGRSVTISAKVVNSPVAVDRQYALAVGESVTQSVVSKTTTTITGLPGTSGRPSTSTSTVATTIKFVGRENLQLSGKTYATCKFESRISSGASGVTTTWVIDGKGIPVQVELRVNGVLSGLRQEATSVKLNGQEL